MTSSKETSAIFFFLLDYAHAPLQDKVVRKEYYGEWVRPKFMPNIVYNIKISNEI